MNIFQLLRNPLVKFIGVAAIIYFGLFANKKNPDSLGNRLSAENLKKNFGEAGEKAKFIATNVKMAQEIATDKKSKLQNVANSETISCGDIAEISYAIFDEEGQKIQFSDKEKINVGVDKNSLIEKNIINMKHSETKIINLSKLSEIDDQKLNNLLKASKSNLKIQITILNFEKNQNSAILCN